MKRILIILLVTPLFLFAQDRYTVSGTISEGSTGETLFGASVYLEGESIGSTTNEYGFYSLSAPGGNYTLVVSYMGFEEQRMELQLDKDQNLNVELVELSNQLNEVVF